MVNVISVFHFLFNSFVCLRNIVIDDCKNFSSLIIIECWTKFLTADHETNRVHCEDQYWKCAFFSLTRPWSFNSIRGNVRAVHFRCSFYGVYLFSIFSYFFNFIFQSTKNVVMKEQKIHRYFSLIRSKMLKKSPPQNPLN